MNGERLLHLEGWPLAKIKFPSVYNHYNHDRQFCLPESVSVFKPEQMLL
jgi:hypothetical protein